MDMYDEKMMNLLELVYEDRVVWERETGGTEAYKENKELVDAAVKEGLLVFFPSNNPRACRRDYMLSYKGLSLHRSNSRKDKK